MFSPLFGWAGVWGDLDPPGLATYFYMAFLRYLYTSIVRTELESYDALGA